MFVNNELLIICYKIIRFKFISPPFSTFKLQNSLKFVKFRKTHVSYYFNL